MLNLRGINFFIPFYATDMTTIQTGTPKVLFPADLSDSCMTAWETAKAFAKTYNAEVVILYVLEEPAFKLVTEYNSEVEVVRARKRLSDFIAEKELEKEIAVSGVVKIGKPYKKIQEAAMEMNPIWIVMGTHGAEGMQELLIGSNASKVVRSAPCPCITVRHNPVEVDFNSIILPLDLTKESKEKISQAVDIAHKFNAEIHLVSNYHHNSDVVGLLEKQMEVAAKFIEDRGVKVTTKIFESNRHYGDAILEYTADVHGDMICIMAQQDKSLREYFVGTEAEHIVNRSPVPVISIRPMTIFVAKADGSIFG